MREIQGLKQATFKFEDFEGLELTDTTGAGDSFTGGFAVGLLEFEKDEKKSLELATKSAFFTISRFGAGPAMPLRTEIKSKFD